MVTMAWSRIDAGALFGIAGALALGGGWGCSRAAPAPATAAAAPAAAAAREVAPGEAEREELTAALARLRPSDVLAALPAALRQELDDALGRLRAEDREGVRTATGAEQAPLLHLAAGGSEPSALLALATGGAAQALVEIRLAAGRPVEGLAPAITALSAAAATRWLADSALDLATPSGLTPERCADVARAAEALERGDLQLLAARAALALGDTRERQLELAHAAARELRVEEARAALAAAERAAAPATGAPGAAGVDPARLAEVRAALAAAELAAGAATPVGADAIVARGRALIALGRARDAAALLAPHRAAAERHLALAATLALADLGGTACPGLPPTNQNLIACAAAWSEDRRVGPLAGLLEQAWAAGGGRDRAAIEAYLGLVHVMPWLYASFLRTEVAPEIALKESIAAVTDLELRAREAAAAEPRLAGLALFVELLRTGLESAAARAEGSRVTVSASRRADLVRRAVALGPSSGEEPLTQAAILGVAAMLAQDDDPAPLLAALPEAVDPRHRATRATLELWRAVAHDDAAAAERGRAGFQALLADPTAEGDRSHLVLTLAEAEAALRGRTTDYATLYQVATKLDDPGLPRATRLRLVLDRVGALARTGRRAEAITVLVPFAEPEIGPGTATEIDLGAMARAYLVVLRAREAAGSERAEYATKLAGFAAQVEGQVAVGVGLWHGLWLRELGALVASERCRGGAACLARVERVRPVPTSDVEAFVGAESARIVSRGTVPLGAVTASFTYSVARGLEPRVTLDPLLLAVELPPPAAGVKAAPGAR